MEELFPERILPRPPQDNLQVEAMQVGLIKRLQEHQKQLEGKAVLAMRLVPEGTTRGEWALWRHHWSYARLRLLLSKICLLNSTTFNTVNLGKMLEFCASGDESKGNT